MPKLVAHLEGNGKQLKNVLLDKLAADPGSPVEGRVYYNTTSKYPFIYNGTSFLKMLSGSVDLSTSEATGTLAAARLGTFTGGDVSSVGGSYALTVDTVGGATAANIADAVTKRHSQNTDTGTTSTTFTLDSDAGTPVKLKNNTGVIEGRNDADNAYVGAKFSVVTLTADPTNALEAATKQYVDAVGTGLRDFKESVRVATAAALPANTRTGNVLTATANGSLNGTGIDGVTNLAVNDRVLVKDEVTGANNGFYYVSDLGSAGTPWTLTRSTDADSDAEVTAGVYCFVSEGTANADSAWVLSTNDPITVNTTALTFVQFSGLGQVTAGNYLTKTGNTIDHDTSGVTPGTYTSVTVDSYGHITTATNPTNGYAASIGNATDTTLTVTHNLGTLDVLVEVYENATGDTVLANITRTTTNALTVTFDTAPATNAYRVLVRKAV